jgi:cyanophycinase
MLILIGGSDGYCSEQYLKDIINKKNIESVAIIPTASTYQSETFESYERLFRNWGLRVERIFDPMCERAGNIFKEIGMIFMTGGDQRKLVDKFSDNENLKIIKTRCENNEIVICGTSAGSMVVSDNVISGDDKYCLKGMSLLNYTVDTHFSERKRLHRLIEFMDENKIESAMGIDEDTLVAICNYGVEVYGKGKVFILNKLDNCINIKTLQSGKYDISILKF